MKYQHKKRNPGVNILSSSMTFENIRFFKRRPNIPSKMVCSFKEVYKNDNFANSEFTNFTQTFNARNNNSYEFKLSDLESNFTSISQTGGKTNTELNNINTFNISKSKTTDQLATKGYDESRDAINLTLSTSTKEEASESDESFLPMDTRQRHKYDIIELNESFSCHTKPLRLFSKNGKPLTDRTGRPLIDILGQPLVHIDVGGRSISDHKGNQVFNSRGESAIYSTTNLHIPPSEEEPGIPVIDVEKKHILFLFDSKGHPLTDHLGRPLLKASGSLMFGINNKDKNNVNKNKNNQLKNLYGKAPLENCVRRVQIFNYDLKPLTNEDGQILTNATIVCNNSGMPMCDEQGRPLFFKYGTRIIPQIKQPDKEFQQIEPLECQTNSSTGVDMSTSNDFENTVVPQILCSAKSEPNILREDEVSKLKNSTSTTNKEINPFVTEVFTNKDCFRLTTLSNSISDKAIDNNYKENQSENGFQNYKFEVNLNKLQRSSSHHSSSSQINSLYSRKCSGENNVVNLLNLEEHKNGSTGEAFILYDASKKVKAQKSSLNALMKNNRIGLSHSLIKKTPYSTMLTVNFVEYFKKALNLKTLKSSHGLVYNDYGIPMKDVYGSYLYDKYGIPLTGAKGIKLSEKARRILRFKLRNIPVVPVNKDNFGRKMSLLNTLTYNESHDQFGDPLYDKVGRPRFDQFGKLIYDFYGRPLTDAFRRPLIDGIGQPLMDSNGNVLTSSDTSGSAALTDVYGRPIYDKRGRALFDSYGRPRFDVYTNAIYDNCGRPASDGNGNTLCDFMNKPIRPYPEKPLYKNARALLPQYIDKILASPSMRIVLKYSHSSLKDVFGGPLFDEFGRPLYNKIGKPLYDKYGRPIYDKDGIPLCDCYGRPISEEIRQSENDKTLSVVDSLKLLKLTKESSNWMEIKRSQTQALTSTKSGVLDDAYIMKVIKSEKKKTTKYTYALTRVTTFTDGRQALEILEAPLSPATAKEMYHLPLDNKPMVMLARRRKIVKRRCKPHAKK